MSVILSRNIRLVMLGVLVLLGLACNTGEFLITLTPGPEEIRLESTMTPVSIPLPTVVYPTLTQVPSSTPTVSSAVDCDTTQPVDIVCKATVCVVRNDYHSGRDNIAYTVPNETVLRGAFVCICPTCALLERNWFYLGQSGEELFWAINMNKVWELENGEE